MRYIVKLALRIIENRVRAYDSRHAKAIATLPDDPCYDAAVCLLEDKAIRLSDACRLLKSELTGGTA